MDTSKYVISSAFRSTGTVRNDFHNHDDYELIYVEEGAVDVCIGNRRYTAKKDDLILLANLEQHSLHPSSSVYHRYCVALRVSVVDSYIQNPELLSVLKNHPQDFVHCVNMALYRDYVVDIFRKMIHCCETDPYANDYVCCLLTELLIYICKLHPYLQVRSMNETCKSRILEIQKYLRQHFREPIRISDVCKQYYISNHYLSHQFKALTGYSPKQYLLLIRLKQTAITIRNSNEPINDIAYSCGFSDISNFCKQFKQEYGCTPSSFRQRDRIEFPNEDGAQTDTDKERIPG